MYKILQGDTIEVMKTLDAGSVDMCVTSPPYYGLRDYGVGGQIGLEQTPEEYVAKLVEVFREVKRVLRDDGTLWLNLGDSYAGGAGRWGGNKNLSGFQSASKGSLTQIQHTKKWEHSTIKPKDLIGIPWRVAFALQADGWYLRSDIIWHKPNPMPESVKDRPTKSHEYIFLLSKNKKYYYDHEAIKETAAYGKDLGLLRSKKSINGKPPESIIGNRKDVDSRTAGTGFRNKRTVWTVNTKPFKGAHFAVFPPKLITPCILAGSREGGVVLDPFCGSGTTGVVSAKFGRDFIGIELNPEYVKMAEKRIYKASQQMRLL